MVTWRHNHVQLLENRRIQLMNEPGTFNTLSSPVFPFKIVPIFHWKNIVEIIKRSQVEFLEQWLFLKLCECLQFGTGVRSIPAAHCWEGPVKSLSAWRPSSPRATSSRCVKWDRPQAKLWGKRGAQGVGGQGRRCSSSRDGPAGKNPMR